MAKHAVDQLVQRAADHGTAVSALLADCCALADEHGSFPLRAWASFELGGYPDEERVPPYRLVQGELRYEGVRQFFPVNQAVTPDERAAHPFLPASPDQEVRQGTAAIELMLADAAKARVASVDFPVDDPAAVAAWNADLLAGDSRAQRGFAPANRVDRLMRRVTTADLSGVLLGQRHVVSTYLAKVAAGGANTKKWRLR